jgi:hypothetical protein
MAQLFRDHLDDGERSKRRSRETTLSGLKQSIRNVS